MNTLLRLILALILVIFFSPASSNAQTDETTMMEQAKLQLSAGKLYFATSWLERILKTYPKTLKREEVLLLLSKAYAASGRDERAAKTLRTLLKEYPKAVVSLDPTLLKMAESVPQPELVSTAITIPSAPKVQAEKNPTLSPPAEPAKVAAITAKTAKNIPKSEAAPADSKAKSVVIPPTVAPATPNVEKAQLTGKPNKTTETVKSIQKSATAPLIKYTPPIIKPVETTALLPTPAESTAKTVTILPTTVPATSNLEKPLLFRKPNKSNETVTYTLDLGVYVDKSMMIDTMSRINKAGLSPLLEQGLKMDQQIIRLYIGEFSDQEFASKEQEKLRKSNVHSYILMDGSKKLHVFVGAYLDQNVASKEQQRLSDLGINLSLKKVLVSVPTFLLTVGSFKSRETALETAVKLEKQGVKSTVVIQMPLQGFSE